MGARSAFFKMLKAAFWAFFYVVILLSAIVAFQSVVFFMQSKAYFAIGAFWNVSALPAAHKGSEPPSVDKKHGLTVFFYGFVKLLQQRS